MKILSEYLSTANDLEYIFCYIFLVHHLVSCVIKWQFFFFSFPAIFHDLLQQHGQLELKGAYGLEHHLHSVVMSGII